MSFRYNTRQTKGKEPVTQQPGAKKTSKDSLGKVTSEVTVQAKSYVTKPVQATGVKDTSRASASSQPKRPSQPSVATENASLRDKVASLETELQESNDKVRDLEANLERKGEREKEEALKVTDLESELQKSNDKVKDLEANVERIQREKEDALREERESTKIDKAALQNHIRTLQQEKDNLEGKFDAAKKAKGEEDKKELESELERMKNELEKLRRDKDQEIKNFEKLQQTLEQTEIKMGELNDRHDKVDKDRREIVAERKKLEEEKERLKVLLEREKAESKKSEMLVKEVKDVREQLEKEKIEKAKHMEELENAKKELEKFYKEQEQQQAVHLLQKPSSEVDEDAFHSFESNSSKSSPKVPRPDVVEQHKRIHQQAVKESIEALKNRDHGNLEDSILDSWEDISKEAGFDHEQCKTAATEEKPEEVIAQLKEQLSKQSNEARKQQEEIAQLTEQLSKPSDEVQRQQREIARLKDKLEREGKEKEAFKHKILKEAESDKATVFVQDGILQRRILELERTISEKGLLIEQLQTQQSKPSDLLQPTAPDAQPHSLGEMSTRGKVPTVKRQQSYETVVSIQVSPSELTESALHSSLERQSGQQHAQTQIEEQATPVKQDFTVATIVDLCKQLKASRKEVERLQREEPNSEIETLKRDLEDARKTIGNLQDDLTKTVEKYTKVVADMKTLHEEKEKILRDTTEWDRNRQVSVRKQEERLEREQVERAADADNHSDQAKAYQRTIHEIRLERDQTEANLAHLRVESVTNKREVGNFKMKFECSQKLEQQLRDEIHQLKQENAHLVRGAQTEVNCEGHSHYGYQHGGEDVDLIVATLRPENSHLLEQNRQQKKYFEIQSLRAAGEEVCESMPNAVAPRERLADSEVDREAHQQARIDQLQVENCDLKIKLGELHRRFLEFEQHPRHHEHSIPPHQGDAYRYNESDEMTRSSLDSSLEQSISNLPPPISRVRPVIPQTTSHTSPILPHNRVADRDGITQEIKKAEELKKPPKGLPVADDVDEKLWPYDPNLDCPHCGKRFRHGQIREFRYHIDDEHSSSSIM